MIRIFKVFSILLILLMLVGNSDVVHAQEYYFAVETQTMEVFVNEDGSLSIEYTFDFVNQVLTPLILSMLVYQITIMF